jgi:hypothetical protein
MSAQSRASAFETLKEYWQVFASVVFVIFTWASFQWSVKDHQRRIELLELSKSSDTAVLLQVQKEIASLNAKIDFLIEDRRRSGISMFEN